LTEDKKDPDYIDGVLSEDEVQVRIFKLDEPGMQFHIALDETLPGYIILVNFAFGWGFALPANFAHQFAHKLHEGLEHLTGGDPQDNEPKNKITLH